jgi:hypothetical protein
MTNRPVGGRSSEALSHHYCMSVQRLQSAVLTSIKQPEREAEYMDKTLLGTAVFVLPQYSFSERK